MPLRAVSFTPLEVLESLTITRDVMPHHYVARAVIADLQPTQMVAAIRVVEQQIQQTYPHPQRTGWRASADGIYLYFYAWSATQPAAAVASPRTAAA